MKRTLYGEHLAPEDLEQCARKQGTRSSDLYRHSSLQMRAQSFLPPVPTYTHAGSVALGDIISSSLELYIEASHKEGKKRSNQCHTQTHTHTQFLL